MKKSNWIKSKLDGLRSKWRVHEQSVKKGYLDDWKWLCIRSTVHFKSRNRPLWSFSFILLLPTLTKLDGHIYITTFLIWMTVQFGSKSHFHATLHLKGRPISSLWAVHFHVGPFNQTWSWNWNEIKENELFVPFKFADKACCGIMDERMKRKYTEMVFHFFQEYFPGTRIYEGKFIKNIAVVRNPRTEFVRDFKMIFVLVGFEVSNSCWSWSVTWKPS